MRSVRRPGDGPRRAGYDSRVSQATEGREPTRGEVLAALGEVLDPEVGLDVVSLGLVYGVRIDGGVVRVEMTMTTPACPLGDALAAQAAARVEQLTGVRQAIVTLVWEPPWEPGRMSEEARRQLGWAR